MLFLATCSCIFLLALVLCDQTCNAKEFKTIDGIKVFGETIEIECYGSKCCLEAINNVISSDTDYMITGYYVTKVEQNGNSALVTCVVFIPTKK
jgi:hypothetical protein